MYQSRARMAIGGDASDPAKPDRGRGAAVTSCDSLRYHYPWPFVVRYRLIPADDHGACP